MILKNEEYSYHLIYFLLYTPSNQHQSTIEVLHAHVYQSTAHSIQAIVSPGVHQHRNRLYLVIKNDIMSCLWNHTELDIIIPSKITQIKITNIKTTYFLSCGIQRGEKDVKCKISLSACCMCQSRGPSRHVWWSEDKLQELGLSYHVDPRNWTQAVMPLCK